jgi:hypothetical protein
LLEFALKFLNVGIRELHIDRRCVLFHVIDLAGAWDRNNERLLVKEPN